MNTAAGSSVLAQPSAAFLLSCHQARSSYVPVLSLPQADRKPSKIKQGKRKKTGEKKIT